jgi:hypothetical protein
MNQLPDLRSLADGVRANCGTGILFWAAMLWFVWGFAVIAIMPLLWVFQSAGYDPILIFMMSGGGWFAYGLILSIIVTEVNSRKDERG